MITPSDKEQVTELGRKITTIFARNELGKSRELCLAMVYLGVLNGCDKGITFDEFLETVDAAIAMSKSTK